MPYNEKETVFIDGSSISGSTEELRNDLGIAWKLQEVQNTDGTTSELLHFVDSAEMYPQITNDVTADPTEWLLHVSSVSQCLRYVELQPYFQATGSTEVIVPNYVLPGRFYGAEEPDGKIRSDKEWKTYLLGGAFGNKTYKGIYSKETFDNFGFQYNTPYSNAEAAEEGMSGVNSGSIHYNYNLYMPEFEKAATRVGVERLLPSIELMKVGEPDETDNPIYKFLTLEGAEALDDTGVSGIFDAGQVFSASHVSYIPPIAYENTEVGYIDITKNLRDYLTTYSRMSLSSSIASAVGMQTRNLFYNRDAANGLFDNSTNIDVNNVLSYYPSYVQLEFDRSMNYGLEGTHFRDAINDYSFSSNLLYLLKKQFGRGSSLSKTFATQQTFKDAGEITTADSSTDLKTANFIEMLVNAYSPSIKTNDCYFVGAESSDAFVNSVKARSTDSLRFINSYSTLNVLSRIVAFLDEKYDPSTSQDISSYLNHTIEGKNGIYQILEKSDDDNYHETIAYRIKKERAGTTIQDIWMYNDFSNDQSDDFRFSDSQVLYGETYTYTVYAYVLCTGIKYKMDDLRVGRNIGIVNPGETTEQYCIQFHDPLTNEIQDQLFSGHDTSHIVQNLLPGQIAQYILDGNTYDATRDAHMDLDSDGDVDLHDMIAAVSQDPESLAYSTGTGIYHGLKNPLAGANNFSSNAQTLSEFPYLADFNLYYEPELRLFEVPIMTKEITVLDHPAGGLDVTPFQKIDNSQTLGFFVKVESFEPSEAFPQTLTQEDVNYKDTYLVSNDLIEDVPLGARAVSNQATIEIFRIVDKKPSSLSEFGQNLYKTISLEIGNTKQYLPNYIFYDKVQTNKKYYYLMRILTAKGTPGNLSPIIEAELVSDGGYKYSLFDNLFEEDLKSDPYVGASKEFKKLLQVFPTPPQLQLVNNGADLTQTAASQLDKIDIGTTDDSIFGQTFKVRLTSKKTGKKIDLNLSFNLQEEL
jgi:hypothetical protein